MTSNWWKKLSPSPLHEALDRVVAERTAGIEHKCKCLEMERASQEKVIKERTAELPSIEYTPGEWFNARTIDQMQQFYLHRLPAIREAARGLGYAIGTQGSQRRDFDLMAMQWREDAADPDELAHAIAKATCGITRNGAYQWEKKPLGRIAVSIPICWTDHANPDFKEMLSVGHIDLSVITIAEQNAEIDRLVTKNLEWLEGWNAQQGEIDRLNDALTATSNALKNSDAEIAELKKIITALQMPRPGDDLAKGVCSECKAIGAAYKIGMES